MARGSSREDKKQEEEGRRACRSWRDVPLAFLAFVLLGVTVLDFMVALVRLVFGFSTAKLADALIRLVVGGLISCALLWIFGPPQIKEEDG
ncbi:hypothetical protein OG937_45625 [Streptomyces sp. NBC_00510]